MLNKKIKVISIPQLKDNYSYAIIKDNQIIIIDPADSNSIIRFIKKKKLKLNSILLTHHHHDHTAGIEGILNYQSVNVYSPNSKIKGTTKIIRGGDKLDLDIIEMLIIKTPGHTLDHIVYYNNLHHILFSGDTLFRLGCGRIFEGNYKQMYNSLNKIKDLDNQTTVYCGHEYTQANLSFLISVFPNYKDLLNEKENINKQIFNTKSSIPFNLGFEKEWNPFLSTESNYYKCFKNSRNFSNREMFSYLRDLKNNF